MDRLKGIAGNTVFVIQVLIVFVLIFENRIDVPAVLQAFGRMHPLILHLPIGLLLIALTLYFTKSFFDGSVERIVSFLLYVLAVLTSLTTLMGLFLSREGGYDPDDLGWHKWAGVGLSFLCWLLIFEMPQKIFRPVLVISAIVLIITGHFGATLTHGDKFVLGPLTPEERKSRVITDSSTVFEALVDPILEAKCFSCHNEKKSKGKLILSTMEGIAKGGKNGKLWVPGDAEHSLVMERVNLPLDAKEHMPPADKPQLTAEERLAISYWIERGAPFDIKLSALEESDSLKQFSRFVIATYRQDSPDRLYTFDFAPEETVAQLNLPNRSVFQLAKNEPALEANFYLRETFNDKLLSDLVVVKEQIVSFNLSNMPVEDEDLELLARYKNVQRLILNNTNLRGKTLDQLKSLPKLTLLSLSGTDVTHTAAAVLGTFPALKDVFLWNTKVSAQEAKDLSKKFPGINWQIGFVPEEGELLTLNTPMLKNPSRVLNDAEEILLRHNLPGTVIRYTVDGKEPDSINSPVFGGGVTIDKYTIVKTKAYKEGWKKSETAEFVLFRKGAKPADVELENEPDPAYPGEGAITLYDNVKGMPDFFRHPSWIAFRTRPLVAWFRFDQPSDIKSITISYARNVGAMCMPPQEVEVWAGDERNEMKLIGRAIPVQPDGYVPNRIEGFLLELPPSRHKYYKLVATPLRKLPAFRNGGKERGWLMVDEVFFN